MDAEVCTKLVSLSLWHCLQKHRWTWKCRQFVTFSFTSTSWNFSRSNGTFIVGQIQALPMTAKKVGELTWNDPLLSRVLGFGRSGWLDRVIAELKPYWGCQQELSVESDCLLWGTRVVIPTKLHNSLLEELHRDHPRMSCMKAVASSYFMVAWSGQGYLNVC